MRNDTEKPREMKLYFTEREIEQIDSFRQEWTRLKSRNEMFHVAIEFYMDQLRESGGFTDANGYPVRRETVRRPHSA